jgi:hypothetical protein
MKAAATSAIRWHSDGEISSSGKTQASEWAPENGMAKAEADRTRFMASLLVMDGMNFVPERIGRLSTSQHQNSRGNIAMGVRCVKPDRSRCGPLRLGVG